MKKLMVTGGWIGFLIGVGIGVATEGSHWPAVLWRASVAALCAGVLLRWWGRVWVKCVHQSWAEKLVADAANAPQTNPLKK